MNGQSMPPAPCASSRASLVLILGATGSAGQAIKAAFLDNGWRVRALHRHSAEAMAATSDHGEWVRGDVADPVVVARAAQGAAVIVHAVNPPGYRKWRELGIPMLASAIGAARASGARLVFPGNIYNFGPSAGSLIDEYSPQAPVSRKGVVRVEMENMLARAAQDGVRSVVIRAGDFFGPAAATSWLHAAMVKPDTRPGSQIRRPVRFVTYPGAHDVGHAWAYLPDFAAAVVALAAIERRLLPFDTFHFGGHWIDPGIGMAHAACRALGQPDLPIRTMLWNLLRLAAPFSGFARELLEMQYLWRTPVRLDNRKLKGLLGREPHTPLDEAMRRSIGCVPGAHDVSTHPVFRSTIS